MFLPHIAMSFILYHHRTWIRIYDWIRRALYSARPSDRCYGRCRLILKVHSTGRKRHGVKKLISFRTQGRNENQIINNNNIKKFTVTLVSHWWPSAKGTYKFFINFNDVMVPLLNVDLYYRAGTPLVNKKP